MDQTQTRTRVRQHVREMAPFSDGAVSADSHLVDDLQYDSVALLELAMTLEDEFGLTPMSEERLMDIQTVDEIEAYVLELLGNNA